MSATLEDLPPPPRRFTRRRLVMYSALGLIALAVIAVLLGLLYLRSESFNRFVSVEIEKALETYGLRAEIGPLEPGLRSITLRDVKLLNRGTNQLIATIDRADVSITIRDPFALRLRREIVFDRMDLDGLDLWVVINERGESNFQGLRRPPPLRRRITFDYSKLAGSLKKGAIHYIDRKRDLQSELRDLTGVARPIGGGDPPKVAIRLASGAGHLSGADGDMKIDAVEFIGRVMESGADVERLELRSPAAEVTASGRLNDWQAPDYQLDIKARAQLEEVVALSAPELSLKGGADFDGLIKGGGAQWSASGRLISNKLSLAGVTFNGAQADGIRIEARDGGLTFSIKQARARSILSEGVEMMTASATNLKGTIADGKGQATVEEAIIERIKSGQNEFNGVKLRDIRANFAPDKTKKSREGKWTFSSARLETRTGVAGEVEFTNASASNVKGTISDWRAEFSSDRITAGRAGAGQARFNEITAQEINATFEPGRKPRGGQLTFSSAQLEAKSGAAGEIELRKLVASKAQGTIASGVARVTMEQAKIERAEAKQGDFNEIVMRDISASLGFDQSGAREAQGEVSLRAGSWENIKFGQTSGRFTANRAEISLRGFNSAALGGEGVGDLVIGLSPGAQSGLRVDFTGARAAELLSLLGARTDQLQGTVTGRADVNWPGTNLRALSGEITARFEGQTTTPDAIPIRGEVVTRAQRGVFYFDRFTLGTDASTLTATGSLALDGDSDLRFSITSTRAEELLTIIKSPGLVEGEAKRLLETYEPQIFGDFRFTGTLTGRLDNPTITGDAQVSSFGLRDEILGALKGRLLISPSEIRFEQGALTVDEGRSAKFNYVSPRDAAASTGRFDISFERIGIDSILALLGLPTQQDFVTGEVSGEARLTGLPAAPQGVINLNLVNGAIAGQRADSATARIIFDGQTARIERVEARLAQGRVQLSGRVDLQTWQYQFQGEAQQLGLQRGAEAFGLNVTGLADATFQLSGDFDNPEDFRIEMSAQARQMRINGREAGPVTLTARTAADGRIDVELRARLDGRTQPIIATIEWRRPGRPAEIKADLTDFDIAPFLSIYAPEIAQSVTGRLTGALRVSGPLLDSQGEATIAGLRGALTITGVSLEIGGTPVSVSTPLRVTIGDSQLRIETARITAQGTELRIGGSMALAENATINFSIAGQIDLGAFDRPNDDINLGGEMTIDARISGTPGDPNLSGTATLRDLSASSGAAPIAIDGGSGRVVLSGNRLTLENFTARAGGGTAQISGGATLANLRPVEWRFEIAAQDAEIAGRGVQASANANLTLSGTPQSQTLSGRINITGAEYTSELSLDEISDRGYLNLGPLFKSQLRSGAVIAPISLNVTVEALQSLIVRSAQIDTIASAVLNLTGTLDDPEVSGRITLDGGSIIFRGERYNIVTGFLELPGGFAEPRLELQAESDIRSYRIRIGFSGPINSLELSLSSEPSLTRAEIISLITTGSTESGLMGVTDPTRAGLATAGALLSEMFISKPLGRETQRFLGLNRFQIDPILRPFENPAARLTIGRQLARGLTFIYSTNLSVEQDQIATVEYNFTNRFSIVATYLESGDTHLQGLQQNDFIIEIRGRKSFPLGVSTIRAPIGGLNLQRKTLPLSNLRLNLAPPDEISISPNRLREILPTMREGMGRSQLRLGVHNLTNYLQEKGYLFAEVQARCEPTDCQAPSINELRVIYDVRPGESYTIKDIRIVGASELDEREVTRHLRTKKRSAFGELFGRFPMMGALARGMTSNDRMRDDSETIRDRLADLGYRSAQVEPRLAVSPDCDDVTVTFYVDKGPRTVITDVIVRGNLTIESPRLIVLSPILRGDFFSDERARLGARQIREFYNERGYLDARVSVSLDEYDGDSQVCQTCARLVYEVNEGARAVACCISMVGQTITRESSIMRFLNFKEGDTLTPKALRKTERDLYATGAFREVVVRAQQFPGADEAARAVSVRVTEADPLVMFYGLGFSTDNGPRGEIQFTNNNLFGRLVSGSVKLRVSGDDQLAQAQYTNWRPWGKKWPTTFSAFYNRDADLRPFRRRRLIDENIEPGSTGQSFGINRFVAFVQTERKLSERTLFRFRYLFENAKLFDLENIPETEVTRNEPAIRLGMFSVGFSHDSRDNALLPTRGRLYSADYSIAARELGGNESFNKFFANHQRYYTLEGLGGSTIAISARLGLGQLFRINDRDNDGIISEPERRLPINERFFAGGATTLRGFRFEEAGPHGVLEPRNSNELPTLVPIGGDALVISNFEFRYPLSRRWFLVPFYDWGNVFRGVSDINFGGMTHSVGIGLRVNTPIGPIGVDYGYLIDPPSFGAASGAILRQPHSAFHIRVGQTF